MYFVSYDKDGLDQLALLIDGKLYDADALHPELPNNMEQFLGMWEELYPVAQEAQEAVRHARFSVFRGLDPEQVPFLAPVPHPPNCRDAYAFRQHVEQARRNRGLPMVPEYDQFPVFYFSNNSAVQGPGPVFCMPDHFCKLDYELEVAIVIGKAGRNIRASEADSHIAGFMIMNDWSARHWQQEEMKLNLGPAKGKDFATSFGPFLVSPEELEPYRIPPKEGHIGSAYRLAMKAYLNGSEWSSGNLQDMDWTFAELIERCSYGARLVPGSIIGSGTVGGGCLLELNGSDRLRDPDSSERWLQPGDRVELEVEGLGRLDNTIMAEESDYSLLNPNPPEIQAKDHHDRSTS